jgi:hypothetical protein
MRKYIYILLSAAVIVAIVFAGLRQSVEAPSQNGQSSSEGGVFVLKLKEPTTQSGITITALEVLEDSRCPVDVQCIWAGQVRLRAKITSIQGESEVIFITGLPVTIEAQDITLTDTSPSPRSKQTIKPGDYRFTLKIEERKSQ